MRWRVSAVADRLVVPPADGLDPRETARDRVLDEDCPEDSAVQLTARVLGGNVRLLLGIASVTGALVVGVRLWERLRRRAEHEQVALFGLATAAEGVVVFRLAVLALSWFGALLLVDGDVFAEVLEAPVGALEYVQLAWLTATLATVGGALGAGLEDDDVVRTATYIRSEAGEGARRRQ